MVVQFTADGNWRVLELSDMKPACHYHSFHETALPALIEDREPAAPGVDPAGAASSPFFDNPAEPARPSPPSACPRSGEPWSATFGMTLECVLQQRELPLETRHLDLGLDALNRTALY